jgi:hypothetical protein
LVGPAGLVGAFFGYIYISYVSQLKKWAKLPYMTYFSGKVAGFFGKINFPKEPLYRPRDLFIFRPGLKTSIGTCPFGECAFFV